MRTVIFKGPGQPLAIERGADPVPGAGHVVLKVGRCGICRSDLHMSSGEGPMFPLGTAPGHEYAGEIVALGRDVGHLKIGDRVTALPMTGCGVCEACRAEEPYWCTQTALMIGGFSEFVAADARYVVKLPAALTLSDGALVEPLAAARQAVRLAELPQGAKVLVIGAGPMGLAAVYWARLMGAGSIAVTARSTRNAALAEAMGAAAFVQHGEGLAARVADALKGSPDIVIECVGSVGLVPEAIDCVRPRGTVLVTGLCFHPEPIVFGLAAVKQLRVQFSIAYALEDFRAAVEALDRGELAPRVLVTDTIALDALPATFEALRGPSLHCKVHVDPWA